MNENIHKLGFYFSASSFAKMAGELERWLPKEAAFHPLTHLVLKNGVNKSPLDMVMIDDIERVVVADVVSPPDRFKRYSEHSALFRDGANGKEVKKAFLEECVYPVIKAHPRLDWFTLGHSHPFADEAWLSTGGRESDEGTLNEKLRINQEHNMGFVFEILGYGRRNSTGLWEWFSNLLSASHSVIPVIKNPKALKLLGSWKFAVFGMTPDGLFKLDKPLVVLPNNHSYLRDAKSRPYYQTEDGMKWWKDNCTELSDSGFRVERKYLCRGWDVYNIRIDEDFTAAVCIPPSFPKAQAKTYRLFIIGNCVNYTELDTPEGDWKAGCDDIFKLRLVDLARYYRQRR